MPEHEPPPELAALIAAIESGDGERLSAIVPPGPDPSTYAGDREFTSVETRELTIPGPHGDVRARRYRHSTDPRDRALVWVHGGGFLGGDLDMPEAHWVSLVLAARGFAVLSVDYRKCVGGIHYPVPSDDVLAAWHWSVAHADDLGTTPDRLHLGGASAGGSLTAGVTKRARDGQAAVPASLVLVYPTLHADLPVPGPGAEFIRWMNRNYAGSEPMLEDPYAFPALGDLGGQPPVFILDSEQDPLRASGEAYGAALLAAGVEATVELEPGTTHGHLNDPTLPAARRSLDRIEAWLERH